MNGEKGRFSWLEISAREVKVSPAESQRESSYHLSEGERRYYEGFYEQALRSYARALQYDRGLVPAWAGQVKCLLQMEEWEEAETWVNNALTYHPQAADLLALKSIVLVEKGEKDKALAYSDASFNYKSETGFVWLARAYVLLSLNREKTAQTCMEQVVTKDCQDWRVLMEAGRLYLRAGRSSLAVRFLHQAVTICTDNAYLWFLLASAYQKLHLRSRVRFCCEQALRLRPSFPEAQEMFNNAQGLGCFVATVCLDETEALATLRWWRDRYLLCHPAGRLVVFLYNKTGPFLARVVYRLPQVRRSLRQILLWLVDLIRRLREENL